MRMRVSSNDNHNDYNQQPDSKKIVHENSLELAQTMANKGLIEPGSHNLLVYDDLKTFREIYARCSRALLPQNEIVIIATQYETINSVKNNLQLAGVNDVEGC